MLELNFPEYEFSIQVHGQKKLIFDIVRKKFIPLTHEEWVRQHVLHYLVHEKQCKIEQIAVERELRYNNRRKRFDILVFGSGATPLCIVECKAPEVKLTTEAIFQAGVYNTIFNCPWLWITNGQRHVWLFNNKGTLQPGTEPTQF